MCQTDGKKVHTHPQQFQRHLLVMILDMRWRYFKHSPLEDEFRSGPQNRHEESKFQSCIPNIVSILLCRNPHQHDLMKVVLNMDKIPLKPSDPYFKVYSTNFTIYY